MPENENIKDLGKEQIINEIIGELPTETSIIVDLPSEGKFYTLKDPSQPITLRPMTYEDEKSLVTLNKDQDPAAVLLQKCLDNINVQDLLLMDQLYLIMKLREISYGDDYNTLLICSHCKAENPTTVKLSQLNVNPIPDDFEDPRIVSLPGIKKDVKIRLPRIKDQKYLANFENIEDNLWRFIVEIAGHTDKSIIASVIKKLPLKDIKTILKAFKTDFGLDTHVTLVCNNCGGGSVIDLPIDANFFNVN